MISDAIGDARQRISQTFPERQIYLRSGGEVTYFHLTTRLQVIVVSIIGFIALWCIFSIINVFLGLNPLTSASQEVRQIEARYQRLLADSQAKEENAKLMLAEQRETFELMAANLEAKHQTLSQIVSSGKLGPAIPEEAIQYADASIVMAPTIRDMQDRVARHSQIESHDVATGLPLDNSLRSLDTTQNDILLTAEAELLDQIDFNRALIQATDMNVEEVMQEAGNGQGGPYIPLDGFDVPIDGEGFVSRVSAIQARLSESERLAEAVRNLPLGHPVMNETVMTSDFGVRNDPFTKRPTFHPGLDFIGGSMAPIVSTASGTVIFSGRKGGYGRVIEIDHGHGFVTRYAHLKKSFVKRGQTVEKGERIGGMGSTGRSTATHLHYEVLFQGRAYDPQKFLKASLYVQ